MDTIAHPDSWNSREAHRLAVQGRMIKPGRWTLKQVLFEILGWLIVLVVLLIVGTGVWAFANAIGTAVFTNHDSITLVPCETEDSSNCYWDAETQGNGLGRDFIDISGTQYFAE